MLDKALDRGWVGYYELGDDPRWAAIHDHPRFEALLERALGIVEAQRASW